jgi:hypothetical protein
MLYSIGRAGSWKEQMCQLQGILSTVIRLSFRVMNLRSLLRLDSPFCCWLVHPFWRTESYIVNLSFFSIIIHATSYLSFQFDYLKSLEIEEKINKIRWCETANNALFLLSTNDKTVKLWKVRFWLFLLILLSTAKLLSIQTYNCFNWFPSFRLQRKR